MKAVLDAKEIRKDHRYLILRLSCEHFVIGDAHHNGDNTAFSIIGGRSSSGELWWRCGPCCDSFNSPSRSEREHLFWDMTDGV